MAGEGRLAEQIRARLEIVETAEMSASRTVAPAGQGILEELWMGKPVSRHVKEFSQLFGLISLFIAALGVWKGWNWLSAAGYVAAAGAILLLGYRLPLVLRPVWKGWMKLAEVLSVVVNLVILTVAWVFMFVTVAAALRLFGKRVMDLRYGAQVESYWEDRDPIYDDFKRLERQY